MVFIEADEVEILDMTRANWKFRDNSLLLLHRVETEFDNKTLRKLLITLQSTNVKYILFVPSTILTVRQSLRILRKAKQQKSDTFSGYLRTGLAYKWLLRGFDYNRLKTYIPD